MKLGVTEYIDCAHHLPGHERCGSLHGHTYQVDVFIEGDHKGGMLLDFADLKKTLRTILADYDHKDWNTFIEYPTVENICELISKRMHDKIQFPMNATTWPSLNTGTPCKISTATRPSRWLRKSMPPFSRIISRKERRG